MTVCQRLMKPGTWSLSLVDNAPMSKCQAANLADHIVITSTKLDPIDGFSDANILANAAYTGVITSKPTPRSFAGYDLSWALGTPDGVGDVFTEPTDVGGGGTHTLSYIMGGVAGALNGLTISFDDTGLTALADLVIPGWITYREALDTYTRLTGAEWRVRPTGVVYAALASTLFVTSPTVVVTRNQDGPEGGLRGLDGTMNAAEDIEQYTSRVYAVRSITEEAHVSATSPYKAFDGTTLKSHRAVNAAGIENSLTELATSVLAQYSAKRRELTLSSKTYDVTRFVTPGDYVYAWDQDAQLSDSANQITYRGEFITPQKLRVYALTWPVERGMGVYARSMATGSAVYTDLSNYVQWEGDATNPGEVQWEVGAAARSVSDDTSTAGNAGYLGQNGAIVDQTSLVTIWSGVTFSGTWVNYGGTAQTGQYRRVGDSVEVRGVIKSGTSGTAAFTLPTGYRPPKDITRPLDASGAYASAAISAAGVFTVASTTGTALVSIDCRFSVSA